MSKRVKTLLIMATLLLLAAALCLFFLLSPSSKNKSELQDFTEIVLKWVTDREQKTEGRVLNNQWVFWGNDSLTRFPFFELTSKERLYLYFPQHVCPPCVVATIGLIKKYIPDYEQNNSIVFISPDWPLRLRNDCYGKRVLSLYEGTLWLPIEKEDAPFFFQLSPQMEVMQIHIVTKVDYKRTEEYIKAFVNN